MWNTNKNPNAMVAFFSALWIAHGTGFSYLGGSEFYKLGALGFITQRGPALTPFLPKQYWTWDSKALHAIFPTIVHEFGTFLCEYLFDSVIAWLKPLSLESPFPPLQAAKCVSNHSRLQIHRGHFIYCSRYHQVLRGLREWQQNRPAKYGRVTGFMAEVNLTSVLLEFLI